MDIVMKLRNKKELITIQLYRALDAVVETGSMTNAAASLHLTQAGISAQIKKLEETLGGPVFEKSGSGHVLTERGKAALEYGRRILALNDQLLAYAGPNSRPRQLSIGMPPWLLSDQLIDVFNVCRAVAGEERLLFRCDSLKTLAQELISGDLDIAYLLETAIQPINSVVEWRERLCWIVAPGFKLAEGAPIPLVNWYGSLTDKYGVRALETRGARFSIEFSSPDVKARLAAVAAGLGYALTNTRLVTSAVQVVEEPFLPKAGDIRSGVYVRDGLDRQRFGPIIQAFVTALEPRRKPAQDGVQSRHGVLADHLTIKIDR
jgi:DNA-binding transcriptional LysR family regulator